MFVAALVDPQGLGDQTRRHPVRVPPPDHPQIAEKAQGPHPQVPRPMDPVEVPPPVPANRPRPVGQTPPAFAGVNKGLFHRDGARGKAHTRPPVPGLPRRVGALGGQPGVGADVRPGARAFHRSGETRAPAFRQGQASEDTFGAQVVEARGPSEGALRPPRPGKRPGPQDAGEHERAPVVQRSGHIVQRQPVVRPGKTSLRARRDVPPIGPGADPPGDARPVPGPAQRPFAVPFAAPQIPRPRPRRPQGTGRDTRRPPLALKRSAGALHMKRRHQTPRGTQIVHPPGGGRPPALGRHGPEIHRPPPHPGRHHGPGRTRGPQRVPSLGGPAGGHGPAPEIKRVGIADTRRAPSDGTSPAGFALANGRGQGRQTPAVRPTDLQGLQGHRVPGEKKAGRGRLHAPSPVPTVPPIKAGRAVPTGARSRFQLDFPRDVAAQGPGIFLEIQKPFHGGGRQTDAPAPPPGGPFPGRRQDVVHVEPLHAKRPSLPVHVRPQAVRRPARAPTQFLQADRSIEDRGVPPPRPPAVGGKRALGLREPASNGWKIRGRQTLHPAPQPQAPFRVAQKPRAPKMESSRAVVQGFDAPIVARAFGVQPQSPARAVHPQAAFVQHQAPLDRRGFPVKPPFETVDAQPPFRPGAVRRAGRGPQHGQGAVHPAAHPRPAVDRRHVRQGQALGFERPQMDPRRGGGRDGPVAGHFHRPRKAGDACRQPIVPPRPRRRHGRQHQPGEAQARRRGTPREVRFFQGSAGRDLAVDPPRRRR